MGLYQLSKERQLEGQRVASVRVLGKLAAEGYPARSLNRISGLAGRDVAAVEVALSGMAVAGNPATELMKTEGWIGQRSDEPFMVRVLYPEAFCTFAAMAGTFAKAMDPSLIRTPEQVAALEEEVFRPLNPEA